MFFEIWYQIQILQAKILHCRWKKQQTHHSISYFIHKRKCAQGENDLGIRYVVFAVQSTKHKLQLFKTLMVSICAA